MLKLQYFHLMKRAKSLEKSNAGLDCKQVGMGVTENKTVDCWHNCLNGHELEQIPEDNEGQGSLVCCSSWGFKEVDMTV